MGGEAEIGDAGTVRAAFTITIAPIQVEWSILASSEQQSRQALTVFHPYEPGRIIGNYASLRE